MREEACRSDRGALWSTWGLAPRQGDSTAVQGPRVGPVWWLQRTVKRAAWLGPNELVRDENAGLVLEGHRGQGHCGLADQDEDRGGSLPLGNFVG